MGILNAKTITNLYLYGTENTPVNKVDEALIRPERKGVTIIVNTSEVMSSAGRFAVTAQFYLVKNFFNDYYCGR